MRGGILSAIVVTSTSVILFGFSCGRTNIKSQHISKPDALAASFPNSFKIKKDNNKSMLQKNILLLLGLMLLYNSCCPFIKEESLGRNFYLSEFDNVDRRILYSEESCSNSGIEIVPMTVTEYAYNTDWIVAKSSVPRQKNEYKYWIVDKNFQVKIIQDNDSTINVIKSHVFGPLDSTKFVHSLFAKNIKLTLHKIQ